jgi:hypothetical protein
MVDQSWMIGFGNQALNLTRSETFPIDITLDGKEQIRLFGTVAPAAVYAAIPSSVVLNQFRKAHFMVAEIKGETVQFKLDAIGSVLAAISNCVAKVKANGIASAGDFSYLWQRQYPNQRWTIRNLKKPSNRMALAS